MWTSKPLGHATGSTTTMTVLDDTTTTTIMSFVSTTSSADNYNDNIYLISPTSSATTIMSVLDNGSGLKERTSNLAAVLPHVIGIGIDSKLAKSKQPSF